MMSVSIARTRPVSVNWYKPAVLVTLLVLLAALVPLAQPQNAPPRAQAALLELARFHPEQRVGVIVQKQGAGAEALVAQLGGAVTDDLHIINAFAATLPAGAVAALAQANPVRWVSLNSPMNDTATECASCINTSRLSNAYIKTIGADQVWNQAPYLQGQGIGVAVVDSGVNPQQDLYTPMGVPRLVASVAFNDDYNRTVYDGYGHGSHVAGIIGGNGSRSSGKYIGVAPMVNLINVKVSNDNGGSNTSNVIKGLQWINDNRSRYNIRVVNMSLNSAVPESYNTNPIDAAVEILWFNKVVVVVSSGNNGKNALFPPANDPFVITVGAADDRGTPDTSDDVLAPYSGSGVTADGISKPDLVAPGTNIVSLMANPNAPMVVAHQDHVVDGSYFRMSGTSMAAPMVAGAVALLLQDEPNLTPDQVKYRLMATARPFGQQKQAGAGYLNVYATIRGTTTQSANTGTAASRMLTTGSSPIAWNSVNWNSVNWNSVNWNSDDWTQ
jgi:serine protease AprX